MKNTSQIKLLGHHFEKGEQCYCCVSFSSAGPGRPSLKTNFKEALKHSFQDDISVDPGNVLRQTEKCSYYGRSPVSETQGAEIVEEALQRILSAKPVVKSCVVKVRASFPTNCTSRSNKKGRKGPWNRRVRGLFG